MHYINGVAADTYAPVTEGQLTLPQWDYNASTVTNPTSPHTVGTGTAAQSFRFYNFALLHGDGMFSGRVYEANGEPHGVATELRRCVTFTPETATPPADASCVVESISSFAPQRADVGRTGRWDFPSLREGNYVVNIAAPAHNRAKWDATNGIDDDAVNCEGSAAVGGNSDPLDATDPTCDTVRPDNQYDVLQGKRAFNRLPVTYYIYNGTAPTDDVLTAIKVTGTPPNDDGTVSVDSVGKNIATGHLNNIPASQAGSGTDAIDGGTARNIIWEGGSVTVSSAAPAGTAVSPGASYSVWRSVEDPTTSPSTFTYVRMSGNSVTLPTTATGADGTAGTGGSRRIAVRVTAANGYHDHDYTFDVTRAAPVDNNVTAISADTNRSGSGTDIVVNVAPGDVCGTVFGAGCDEYNASVPAGETSVYLTALTKDRQDGISATVDGQSLTAEGQLNTDASGAVVFRVVVPATGVVNKTVRFTVTSEDGVNKTYVLTLNRS